MIVLWKFKKSRRVLGQDPHLHLYVVLLLTHLPMTNKMIKLLVCVCNLAHSEHRLHNTQKTRRRSFLGECKDDDFQQKILVTLCNVCPFNLLQGLTNIVINKGCVCGYLGPYDIYSKFEMHAQIFGPEGLLRRRYF